MGLVETAKRIRRIAAAYKKMTPQVVKEEVLQIAKRNEVAATNLITDQLWQGEDMNGRKFENYSLRSVQVFNKPPGPIRWFDTGDYYSSIFMNADKFPIVFGSTDIKEGKIAERLATEGRDIQDSYGLQKQNLKEFAKTYILEELQAYVRGPLHL